MSLNSELSHENIQCFLSPTTPLCLSLQSGGVNWDKIYGIPGFIHACQF